MNRRRLNSWMLWLLPLIALRAIIPVGFMLSASPTGLQFTLCTSATSQSALVASAHSMHEAHVHHTASSDPAAQTDHSTHEAHARSICPYAVASTVHAPSVPHVASATPAPASIIDFLTHPDLKSFPVLIDRIRGPPLA